MIKTGYEIIGMIKDGKAPKKIKQGTVYFNYKKEEENIGYRYYQQGTYWILDLMKELNDEFEIIEEPKVWKPKEDEEYWYIANAEEVASEYYTAEYDKLMHEIGNCFKTPEEAERTREKIKIYVKLKRYAEEHNTEKIDWNDENQCKWYIDRLYVNTRVWYTYNAKKMWQVYFSSKELAEQAIQEIGEDNIRKLFEK